MDFLSSSWWSLKQTQGHKKYFLLFFLLSFTTSWAQDPYTGGTEPLDASFATAPKLVEDRIVEIINQYRMDKGLAPFRVDSRLTEMARQHVFAMRARGYVDRENFGVRFQEAQDTLPKLTHYAENIAFTFPNKDIPGYVTQTWLQLPRFQQNLLYKFELVGIALERDAKGNSFIVMNFARERHPNTKGNGGGKPEMEMNFEEDDAFFQNELEASLPPTSPLIDLGMTQPIRN